MGVNFQNGEGVAEDFQQAMYWYRKAAAGGDAGAMTGIGYMYDNAQGVPLDHQQAMTWYLKAAAGGDTNAMQDIGILYDRGQGVPQDYEQGLVWYRKAADAGDAGAMRDIGLDYEQGWGVARDYAQAMTWYRKAAERRRRRGDVGCRIHIRQRRGRRSGFRAGHDLFTKRLPQWATRRRCTISAFYMTTARAWLRTRCKPPFGIARPPPLATILPKRAWRP